MQIANPIYDVVFKYLLDDNKIAKKFISLIIGQSIEKLELKPSEHRASVKNKNNFFSVFRIDFAATILLEGGERKQVIIELQKAKLATDLMRFRRYLATQYSDGNNVDEDEKPLPILSIYILGHKLEHINSPVIEVTRTYTDRATGERIKEKDAFIEALTHDSFIIQLAWLREKRRTLLEQVLHIFGEDVQDMKKHLLNIDESNYPKKYTDLIRRLQRAVAEPEVREVMNIEDDILKELCNRERKAEDSEERAQKAEKQADQEKRKAEQEKRKAEEAEKKAEQEKKKAEEAERMTRDLEAELSALRKKLKS